MRTAARTAALALACLLAAAGAAPATGAALLAEGEPVAATAGTAGGTATFAVAAGDGDYVRGTLTTTAGRHDLELLDREGRPVRRLLDGATGEALFQFVTDGGQALRVTAREGGGAFVLTVTRRVPPERQETPVPVPLSPTVARLAEEVRAGGTTDAFWAMLAERGTPLVEPHGEGEAVLTFAVRGAERNVRLLGAPSGDHEALERLGTSDVWYRSFVVPATTRLSYQIAPDVPELPGPPRERRVAILATAQADPLNRHPWPADAPDRFGRSSTVELPDAPEQPGLAPGGAPGDVPRGSLTRLRFASARLGNEREIILYRPAAFDPARPDTVLLVLFDAGPYTTRVPTPAILDALITDGRLPPVVAAFVANPDQDARARELPGNAVFADVMAGELLPTVARAAGLTPRPERTVLAGSSYGGLAAATIALAHPEAFGNALSLSGSFWWHPAGSAAERPEHVARIVVERPRVPVRFHLSAGLFETGHGGTAGILDTSRHLRDVLEAKGYAVSYREYAAGHDYLAWRGALADGLIALFGSAAPAPAARR